MSEQNKHVDEATEHAMEDIVKRVILTPAEREYLSKRIHLACTVAASEAVHKIYQSKLTAIKQGTEMSLNEGEEKK